MRSNVPIEVERCHSVLWLHWNLHGECVQPREYQPPDRNSSPHRSLRQCLNPIHRVGHLWINKKEHVQNNLWWIFIQLNTQKINSNLTQSTWVASIRGFWHNDMLMVKWSYSIVCMGKVHSAISTCQHIIFVDENTAALETLLAFCYEIAKMRKFTSTKNHMKKRHVIYVWYIQEEPSTGTLWSRSLPH